jgi:hypothetical protein
MAKSKEKKKFPRPDTVPALKPLLEQIAQQKDRVTKKRAAAVKDGKLQRHDPALRAAAKRLRRLQRKASKEVKRLFPAGAPKAEKAAAPASAPPAAAPAAAPAKTEAKAETPKA